MKVLNIDPEVHELKILPEYFQQVVEGRKNFEIRKDDRGYEVGDTLHLREWEKPTKENKEGTYTGRSIKKKIIYIFEGGKPGYGLKEQWVILGLEMGFESSKRLEK